MQNSNSPESSKKEFDKASEITDSTRIGIEIEKIGSTAHKAQFQALKERQGGALEKKKKDLEEERPKLIATLQQKYLREETEKIHPQLKPKDLSSNEYKIRESAAHAQAKAHALEIGKEALSDMKNKCLRDQQDILNRARSSHMRNSFNKEAKEGLTQTFTQSKSGRSL